MATCFISLDHHGMMLLGSIWIPTFKLIFSQEIIEMWKAFQIKESLFLITQPQQFASQVPNKSQN